MPNINLSSFTLSTKNNNRKDDENYAKYQSLLIHLVEEDEDGKDDEKYAKIISASSTTRDVQ